MKEGAFAAGKPKERWDPETDQIVEVIEDQAFHERLDQLREMSNKLNKLLQRRFDQVQNSPYYAWNKSSAEAKQADALPKILHIAVLFRPEFFHSNEVKTEETRFSSDDDQLTIFFHVRSDNTIQQIRWHRGGTQGSNGGYFAWLAVGFFEKNKVTLEDALAKKDLEAVSALVAECFSGSSEAAEDNSYIQETTCFFQKAYKLKTMQEAVEYFADKDHFLSFEFPEVIRNLGKVALEKVLESKLDELISVRTPLVQIKEMLNQQADDVFKIKVPVFPSPEALGSFIPKCKAYTVQLIQKLLKKYKPKIMGWRQPS